MSFIILITHRRLVFQRHSSSTQIIWNMTQENQGKQKEMHIVFYQQYNLGMCWPIIHMITCHITLWYFMLTNFYTYS